MPRNTTNTTTNTATVHSYTLLGVEARPIEVRVTLQQRLPAVVIVGMPAVRESGARIRSAIQASGYDWPRLRIVVEVTPLSHLTQSQALDLPIALAILRASGQAPQLDTERAYVGELSLGGEVRPVRGLLAMSQVGPLAAATTGGPDDHPTRRPLADFLTEAPLYRPPRLLPSPDPTAFCFSDVRGNHAAVRAAVIAATLQRGLVLKGEPGSGKTMLAVRLPGLLPPLTPEERREIATIQDAAGLLDCRHGTAYVRRPFRAPHHTISPAGMLGSGKLRLGEVTLAHHGVLFLDEVDEFSPRTIGCLRQVLSDGLRINHTNYQTVLPASFMLVLDKTTAPPDTPAEQLYLYRDRHPALMERCPVQVTCQRLTGPELLGSRYNPTTARLRKLVARARRWLERTDTDSSSTTAPSSSTTAPTVEQAVDALNHCDIEGCWEGLYRAEQVTNTDAVDASTTRSTTPDAQEQGAE